MIRAESALQTLSTCNQPPIESPTNHIARYTPFLAKLEKKLIYEISEIETEIETDFSEFQI